MAQLFFVFQCFACAQGHTVQAFIRNRDRQTRLFAQGKIKIAKVDVDANPEIPPKFGIRGIPTLIVFKGGNAEATKVGALSKSQLTEFIQEVV